MVPWNQSLNKEETWAWAPLAAAVNGQAAFNETNKQTPRERFIN
uniref:Uncharacterized protein n=1 Tax=Rhizobium rhizogenes TaxID=359 RepID=A0A7S5DRM9_RHIRH|nr:hypothetical protein [Rhizobium rhizogenes]QCL10001.1 hypothetical protein pC5.8d_698 [Rhizobium rhizogenes]